MPPTPDDLATEPADRGLAVKAGLLLIALVLLFAASLAYLLYARGVFERTQPLVLVATDSEGVRVGMDLTFSGFPVGRVRRIVLADDGSVRIHVDVALAQARWLRESSVFVLSRGLVGATSLRAYSGILDDPPLPAGAERQVLQGDATADIPLIVGSARELLAQLAALTRADAALAQTLAQTQRLAERVNGPGGALGVVLGDDAQARRMAAQLESALQRSDALLARSDALLARIDTVVARADERVLGDTGLLAEAQAGVVELRGLLGDARASLARVDALLGQAQAIAGDVRGASADLDLLRAEVEASLRRIDQLVGEVQRRWPFARDTELRLP
jgi:phospholipid/cholesterol/gamma-HCH transport system substrate-binding protein